VSAFLHGGARVRDRVANLGGKKYIEIKRKGKGGKYKKAEINNR
jgi:hypothetical protein